MQGTKVGAYTLLRKIGSGGMGAVWLAEHAMIGRHAAVKILHGEFTQRTEIVQRFFNEARAATAISDPGIVQVFDFGQQPDGTAYIVMELLVGEGLDQRVRERGPMHPSDALRTIRQIAKSLGAAHAVGIVHRDLKPENVFLVRDEEVPGGERAKILDFGIAKLQGDTKGWRTNTSQVMGTPLYMSPEQCRGAGAVDQRTDIYSLGCLLFVLLTGRPPFLAEGSGELIAMHLREAPPHASQFNVRVPPQVDSLIARCLAKDPAERFLNGIEMANAVSELITSLSTMPPTSLAPGPQSARHDGIVHPNTTTLTITSGAIAIPAQSALDDKPRRSPALLIGVGAAGAIVAAVIGYVATRPGPSAKPSQPEASTTPPPIQTPATQPQPDAPVRDPRDELVGRMQQAIASFVTWSAAHKGAACPTAKDLGAPDDPWGHPMQVTCAGQPDTHVIGIVSVGPDGVTPSRDDIESWTLPEQVTESIRGPRWVTRKAGPTRPVRPGGMTPSVIIDVDGDGIPDERTP